MVTLFQLKSCPTNGVHLSCPSVYGAWGKMKNLILILLVLGLTGCSIKTIQTERPYRILKSQYKEITKTIYSKFEADVPTPPMLNHHVSCVLSLYTNLTLVFNNSNQIQIYCKTKDTLINDWYSYIIFGSKIILDSNHIKMEIKNNMIVASNILGHGMEIKFKPDRCIIWHIRQDNLNGH